MKISCRIPMLLAMLAGGTATLASGAPEILRLTPPSALFSFGDAGRPVLARFLPGQRFDLQATVRPDAGRSIVGVEFLVDGAAIPGQVALTPATVPGVPAGTLVASRRAFSLETAGVHRLTVQARQDNGALAKAEGNFEIVGMDSPAGQAVRARNVIILIGDGMGVAHRTAARVVRRGISQGKALAPLAMDSLPVSGLVQTASLNSIVTDSAPGAACYSSGNKANNAQMGVFPDDTQDKFDNPRVELIGEFLARTQGKALGIVTTGDIVDATPAAFAVHTQDRDAGTGIADQYLDEAVSRSRLRVLLGGGRKWFIPADQPDTARNATEDYVLPEELAAAWGAPRGAVDANRNLLAEFTQAGFTLTGSAEELASASARTEKLLGLFALANLNAALDRVQGRRGDRAVVEDYGFPDQPMLDEMTRKALDVLGGSPEGFVLMVEAALIDKQAHTMDTERWLMETVELDRAVEVCRQFAEARGDTLLVVTADHECAGVSIIGASTLSHGELAGRANSGAGLSGLRDGAVGVYEAAGFPQYDILPDGYPATTNIDRRLLIGYGANADRHEDWVTNPRPVFDGQPFERQPSSSYPHTAADRDRAGGFHITGQVPGAKAVHTGSDVPLSAFGPGAQLLGGTMDNTDVFFHMARAAVAGVDPSGSAQAATASPGMVNLSVRGRAGPGEEGMIAGFVVSGSRVKTLLVRGIGPGLSRFGLEGTPLNRPMLELRDQAGVVLASNGGWQESPDAAAIAGNGRAVGAFDLQRGVGDAALLVTLEPGVYTARVSGADGDSGMALVEIYEVQ